MSGRFEIVPAAKGYRWNFVAVNGNVLARSMQPFASPEAARDAIEQVRLVAAEAEVVDLT